MTFQPVVEQPNSFDPDADSDGVTLVLGAPHIGKTGEFKALDDETSLSRVESLSDVEDTDAPVVVDDFYNVYQQASPDEREEFLEAIQGMEGLFLSTRPRDFAWLCGPTTESGSDVDCDLGATLWEAIEQVVVLRYPIDDPNDWEGVDGTVAADTLEDNDRLTYEYGFDGEIADQLTIETYGPTLVPPVGLSLDTSGPSRRTRITGAIQEYLGGTGLSILTSPAKQLGKTAADQAQSILAGDADVDIDQETLTGLFETAGISVGSAVAGGTPFVFALGFLLWRANSGDDMADLADDLFEHLLDDRLTPLERAKLEAALGLPPRTLNSLDDLANSDAIDALATLDDLQDDIETMQAELEDHREELARFSRLLDRATRGLTHLETRLRNEERTLLQREVDPADIEYLPDEEGNEVDQLRERIEDDGTDVVVLRGPHGAGKTTAAYKACRELVDTPDSNYEVRLPRGSASGPEIEADMESSNEQTILYANYQTEVGLGATGDNETEVNIGTVSSRDHLRELQSWTDECAAIVVECRDELHESFNDIAPKKLRQAERIEFERFESDAEAVRETTSWALDVLDYEGEYELVVDDVVELAAGNIEIAKLAARYAATEEKPLSAFDSAMELVYEDIRPVLTDAPQYGKVYERVCLTPGISTSLLRDIFDLSRDEATECGRALAGYLGDTVTEIPDETDDGSLFEGRTHEVLAEDAELTVEETDHWRPRPIIYGRAVVEYEFFRGESDGYPLLPPQRVKDNIKDCLDQSTAIGDRAVVVGLAQSLGGMYERARRSDADDLAELIIDAVECMLAEGVNELLAIPDEIDDEEVHRRSYWFIRTIRTLLSHEVPIPAIIFDQNRTQLFVGTRMEAEREEVDADTYIENLLAYGYANSRSVETELMEGFQSLASDIANMSHEWFDTDPQQFLTNIYAMSFIRVADRESNPSTDAITEWVDEVEARAQAMANAETAHDAPPHQFLENLYAMVIAKLADRESDPTAASVTEWVDEVEARAQAMANAETAHDAPPHQFLTNVYAMVIAKLADRESDPTAASVTEWVDEVEARAQAMANAETAHDEPPGQFLENLYAMVFQKFADKEAGPSDEAVTEWVDHIKEKISATAISDVHSEERKKFIAWTYGLGVAQVLSGESDRLMAWAVAIADKAVDTLPVSELDIFSMVAAGGLLKMENYADLPWLVGDLLNRTVEADTPLGETLDQPVELVAGLVGYIASGTWGAAETEGFEYDYFRAIMSQVAETATTDEAFFHEVATTVADDLKDADDADSGVSAIAVWLVRVYPAALRAVANMDSPNPEQFDSIHDRGREALDTASQDALAAYHVRSLGAVPSAVAPDWHARAFDRVSNDFDSNTSEHLYRTSLRYIATGQMTTGRMGLRGLWNCQTAVPEHSDVPARAGIGFAVYLELDRDDEADTDPIDVLDAIETDTDDLPTAVTTLVTALRDGEPDVTPEDLAANIDPEADDLALADLEALVYSRLLAELLRTPLDDYEIGLAYILDEEPQEAITALTDLWEQREQVDDDSEEFEAILAGGVLLGAHIPLFGADRVGVDFGTLCETIEPHRDRLSMPVKTLFDFLNKEDTDADPADIREEIDSEAEEWNVEDFEGAVVAGLLETLQSEDERSTSNDAADAAKQLEDIDGRDLYRAALGGIAEDEMREAISAFVALWERRETVEDDSEEYRTVLAGGVLLAAHAPFIDTDALDSDPKTIRETIAPHRDRLSDPVRTLFDYLHDDATDIEPESLVEGIDQDADELNFEEFEAVVVAAVLNAIQAEDEQATGDGPNSEMTDETD